MAGIRGATIPKSSFEAGKNRAIGPGSSLARTIAIIRAKPKIQGPPLRRRN